MYAQGTCAHAHHHIWANITPLRKYPYPRRRGRDRILLQGMGGATRLPHWRRAPISVRPMAGTTNPEGLSRYTPTQSERTSHGRHYLPRAVCTFALWRGLLAQGHSPGVSSEHTTSGGPNVMYVTGTCTCTHHPGISWWGVHTPK